MKLWILNHYASNMYRDKAGRHYWFAKKLTEKGYEVIIFCATTFLNGNDVINTKGEKSVTKCTGGIPFVFVETVLSQGNGVDRLRNMGLFYKNVFPVTKEYAKKHGKPDVIIASSVHPLTMVAGIKIAKRFKIPCICEVRDLWPEAIFCFGKAKEKSLLGKMLIVGEHWIYKKADALIFTKEGDIDYLKEKGWTLVQGGDIDITKCHYINNGIDIEAYERNIIANQFLDPDLLDENNFNVIYTGTIRPINNVCNLLDAAAILKSKGGYDNVQFLIFGDGVQLPDLKERVEKEHLDNVKLKGFVDKKYIPYILSRSSVNVLNYSQKNYNWIRGNSSNKLFEYMASGKPIISTVQMGYSLINRYHCGVELDKDTPNALANQIIQLYDMSNDKRDKIGKNGEMGARDFDFGVLTEKLVKVIKETVQIGNNL